MHARVWNVRIQPGRVEDFRSALDALIPAARKEPGFRGVVVLRGGTEKTPEATIIAIWDSLDQVKASEKSLFLYQVISRVLSMCDGFPDIREHDVLLSDLR